MSDIGSVAKGLRTYISGLLYPNGPNGASITGGRIIVQRGWLTNNELTGSCGLDKGVSYVSIMASAGGYRRLGENLGMPWRSGDAIPATVSASVSGQTVTITAPKTGATGIIGVRMVENMLSTVAAYAASATDTGATIAAGLASQIEGATVAGNVLTIPDGPLVSVVVGGHVEATRLTRRQEQLFQVTLWTSTPDARDTIGYALDAAMSGTPWFPDSTGAQCLLKFSGSSDVDAQQASSIFRRVYRMTVMFDTTQEQAQAQMLFGGLFVTAGNDLVFTRGDTPLF